MSKKVFEFVQRTDVHKPIRIINNDEAINLNGYTFRFTVKKNQKAPDEEALIIVDWDVITDIYETSLDIDSDTSDIAAGDYWYCVEVETPADEKKATKPTKLKVFENLTDRA